MGDDDPKVRFRICVSVQGASSLENLRQSAEELKKRTLEDKRLWDEAAAMAEGVRRA
jgi:hypothetical protein